MMPFKIISTITLSLLFYPQFIVATLADEKELPSLSIEKNQIDEQTPNPNLKRAPSSPSEPYNSNPSTPSQKSQQIRIPKSSAVTTTFCSDVKFHQKEASNFPVTLALARPILDQNGNVIAPVNSIVRANVDITDEEIQIEPEAVVIGGRYIDIDTSAVPVPALTNTRSTTFSRTRLNRGQRGVPFRIADNLSNWLLTQQTTLETDTTDLLGFGLSIATGLTRGLNEPDIPDPEEEEVKKIREGMKLTFPLESSVELPVSATNENPYFKNQNSTVAC